jgi:hypothetical protein
MCRKGKDPAQQASILLGNWLEQHTVFTFGLPGKVICGLSVRGL